MRICDVIQRKSSETRPEAEFSQTLLTEPVKNDLPSLFLCNVQSFLPKFDESCIFVAVEKNRFDDFP